MANLDSEIIDISKQIADLEKQRKEMLQLKGHEMFQVLFTEFPKLKTVVWEQYTPYFNDGDACYFGVHDFYAEVEGIESWNDEQGDDEKYDTWKEAMNEEGLCLEEVLLGTWDNRMPANLKKAINAIQNLPDDFFLSTFGDHARITATREGFETESIDHY